MDVTKKYILGGLGGLLMGSAVGVAAGVVAGITMKYAYDKYIQEQLHKKLKYIFDEVSRRHYKCLLI
jgi:hypothetical protein